MIRCSYWQDQTRFFLPSIFIDLFLSFLLLHLFSRDFFFLSFPLFERYGTEMKFSNFSSLTWCVVTLFFIQALQNATFGVTNTAVAQKLSKLAIFHLFSRDFFFLSFPVFERYDTEFKKPEKTPIFMPLLTKIS